jgi:hypothetical protein
MLFICRVEIMRDESADSAFSIAFEAGLNARLQSILLCERDEDKLRLVARTEKEPLRLRHERIVKSQSLCPPALPSSHIALAFSWESVATHSERSLRGLHLR